jgi:NAD(P)H-hydrate epimerase
MQAACPEAMLSLDRYEYYLSEMPKLDGYTAIGAGPGLGVEEQTQKAIKLIIQETQVPLVLDADALNILSLNKTWIPFLPKNTILTPHPKEFERLAGGWKNDFDRLEMLKAMATKHGIYIVLKGANTAVAFPDGSVYFNSTGNPGMATGGSGDVLTGLITGLLAQGYSPGQAAVIGVYIHGLAGDLAARKLSMEALSANDLIDNLGKAFKKLRKKK